MRAFEITEMIQAGIDHIEKWLQQNGYTLMGIEAWQAGSADIKADGAVENIFIQVQPVSYPDAKKPLNATDRFAIKDMAERLKRIAYIAYMVIDDNKNIVGEIIWERVY